MPNMTPLGNQIIPPDPQKGIGLMSSILGVQQQRQNLQTGQALQQSAEAKATQDQQSVNEMQSGVKLLQDPVGNGLVDENGNVTKDAHRLILQSMPSTGDKRYQDLLESASGSVKYKNAWLNLRSDVRNNVSSTLAGVAADPNNGLPEMRDAVGKLKADYAGTPAADDVGQLADVASGAIDKAGKKHGIQGAKQVVMGFSRGGLGNAGITGAGGVGNPGQATNAAGQAQLVNPITGERSMPQLGAGATNPASIVSTPGGSLARPDGKTLVPLESPAAPGAAPASGKLQPLRRPGINEPDADQASYKKNIQDARDEYGAVSNAANNPQNGVQVNRYRNQQILDLTKVAPTGPGKDIWNHIASQFTGESGDAFQKIGHYLAQNSASLAKTMGVPNTNMGAETAAASGGNTAQNPNAIKEITHVNDALNTAFSLYNKGMAKVTNNGSDFSRAASYKQAFGQNLDVNALRWADAHRRKDTEEIDSLHRQFGDSGIAEFTKKLNVLKSLGDKGDLP